MRAHDNAVWPGGLYLLLPVFSTQFHPKKSGAAGLRLINAWLRKPERVRADARPTLRVPRASRPKDGLMKCTIACMDVCANNNSDLVVTEGDQYDVCEKATTPVAAPTSTMHTPGSALLGRSRA